MEIEENIPEEIESPQAQSPQAESYSDDDTVVTSTTPAFTSSIMPSNSVSLIDRNSPFDNPNPVTTGILNPNSIFTFDVSTNVNTNRNRNSNFFFGGPSLFDLSNTSLV